MTDTRIFNVLSLSKFHSLSPAFPCPSTDPGGPTNVELEEARR